VTVLGLAKSTLRGFGVDTRALFHRLAGMSLKAAVAEQGLADLVESLRAVLPDLRDQYTGGFAATEYARYWEPKTRALHAWQVRCALEALAETPGQGLVLADVGDSSGNHAVCLKALAPPGKVGRVVGVNLDPVAVEKVRAKGGEAVLARAEELDLTGLRPDLYLSFQMVEHLTDPVRFLHRLATVGKAERLLVTVPYRRRSRFGGDLLRLPEAAWPERLTAEEVHVYEFSPADWMLLARFAGYATVRSSIYLQYPRRSWLRLMAPLWARLDHEGFLALFLRRDLGLARRYTDW
jgi:SAM-dependent methyltransferase